MAYEDGDNSLPSSRNGVDIQAMDRTAAQDAQLATFGYEQELKRSFGLIGMIGFSFSIVSCWSVLGEVLIVGIEAGGPPVLVWSWIVVTILSLCVAYSMAEMCSAYPLSGGQYSWVAIVGPPRYALMFSWVTGWFMNTGLLAMGAANNFIAANFVLGMAQLNNPSYTIQRWHTVLVSYLAALMAGSFNIFLSSRLHRLSQIALVVNLGSFIIVTITILATNHDKQPASFVFLEFQNDTGFVSPGLAIMSGLLQSYFSMACFEAPSQLCEEMLNPSEDAPKAIIWSVYLGGVTGFIFLVSVYFCITNLDAVAKTPTGVPLIQIFYESTQSVAGATVLAVLMTIGVLLAGNSLMAETSRALWAFSRDHGLPFSKTFSKVNRKSKVPINSILLSMGLQVCLNSIYFASYEGFSTVISIATFGFYISYAMPLFARLWSTFTGHFKIIPGAYSMGKWGPWVNGVGLLYLVFAGIDFNFPQVGPVNGSNMNYCSAAFGIVGLISLVTWVFDGRKNFTGPDTDFITNTAVAQNMGVTLSVETDISHMAAQDSAQKMETSI